MHVITIYLCLNFPNSFEHYRLGLFFQILQKEDIMPITFVYISILFKSIYELKTQT